MQKLADLNAAVTRAKTDRLTKEAMHRQLQASASDRARLDTAPQILTNPFIQQLKGELAALQQQAEQASGRLGKKHPDMIKLASAIRLAEAKLSSEIEKIVQSVRSEYQAALAHENSLVVALNQQKAEALAMNRKAIAYSVLERDVESGTQLYNNLLQRTKETGVTGELRTSNIRIVDPAEKPRTPVSPKRARNELLALFLGTLCACGLVAFFEYMDSHIKSPDEIRAHLGLTHLGMLPVLQQKGDRYPLLTDGVPANFSEALRTFRTNVLFSSAEEGGRALVVTSTAPREGKSLVSSNLAISLAQAGQRTLLVDADLRKPKAHDIFGLSQEPGLSNVLVGDAPMSAAVRETTVPGLSVLVAGRIPPNPTELLGAPRFRELMTTLRTHFDWIIVDTPPVMAVADATAGGAPGDRGAVRGRGGDDEPSRGEAGAGSTGARPREVRGRGVEQGGPAPESVLLLPVLSPRVRAGTTARRRSGRRARINDTANTGRGCQLAPYPILRPFLRLSEPRSGAGSHGALLQ